MPSGIPPRSAPMANGASPEARQPSALDELSSASPLAHSPTPVARVKLRAVGAERAVVSDGEPDGPQVAGAAPPTRLAVGLPALRELLQAAVGQSQDATTVAPAPSLVPHAFPQASSRPSFATSEAVPAPPDIFVEPAKRSADQDPPAPAVPALRALAHLDAVTEDMLVDRLSDRLQERLREQALRQFGFTGGLS